MRMLGGALGIAICNSILNGYVRSHLTPILSDFEIEAILSAAKSLEDLAPGLRESARAVFGEAYNLQMRATIGFCCAQFIAILIMWKKKPLRLNEEASMQAEDAESKP
jgi:hypothetical protein